MKKFIVLFFLVNVSYCQTTLMLDKEKSNIKYSAKHVLHAWEGINNDVSHIMVVLMDH
jgi:hypothetical protein